MQSSVSRLFQFHEPLSTWHSRGCCGDLVRLELPQRNDVPCFLEAHPDAPPKVASCYHTELPSLRYRHPRISATQET